VNANGLVLIHQRATSLGKFRIRLLQLLGLCVVQPKLAARHLAQTGRALTLELSAAPHHGVGLRLAGASPAQGLAVRIYLRGRKRSHNHRQPIIRNNQSTWQEQSMNTRIAFSVLAACGGGELSRGAQVNPDRQALRGLARPAAARLHGAEPRSARGSGARRLGRWRAASLG